jgi:PGF-pre-PGF domain-containing protein
VNATGGNVTLESAGFTSDDNETAAINVTASGDRLASSPEFDFSEDNRALGYFSIDHSQSNEDISTVSLTFRIPKSVVDEAAESPEQITMYRYNESRESYVAQITEFQRETDEAYVFRTTATGFSEWVAGTERPSMRIARASVSIAARSGGETGSATVEARITNEGEADGVYVTKLLLDEDVVEQRRVTVPTGGTVQVTFDRAFEQEGVYSVLVNNVTAGKVQVLSNGTVLEHDADAAITPVTTNSGSGPLLSTLGRVALLALLFGVGYLGTRRE